MPPKIVGTVLLQYTQVFIAKVQSRSTQDQGFGLKEASRAQKAVLVLETKVLVLTKKSQEFHD